MPEIRAAGDVDLGLPELVQVLQELNHVRPAASRQRQRGLVVFEVLKEGVPVTAFLGLVTAE